MNIPYTLVSMAAILRDHDDPNYLNDEHYNLTSIADYLYNSADGAFSDHPEDNLLPEFKVLFDKYGKAYFDKVLDDMYALDSQLTSDAKVQELIDDYNDRLSGVTASTKVTASRWYYYEPMSEQELADLKADILALPGCDKLDMDTRDMEEIGYIMLLPGYNDIPLSDPQYYEKRKQLLKDILRVAKEHGLSRTEDRIEDYGSCWYIVLRTNKPKTDEYDEYDDVTTSTKVTAATDSFRYTALYNGDILDVFDTYDEAVSALQSEIKDAIAAGDVELIDFENCWVETDDEDAEVMYCADTDPDFVGYVNTSGPLSEAQVKDLWDTAAMYVDFGDSDAMLQDNGYTLSQALEFLRQGYSIYVD